MQCGNERAKLLYRLIRAIAVMAGQSACHSYHSALARLLLISVSRIISQMELSTGMVHKVDDLEISQDLKHSRLEWRIERIGWVVMAVIIVAALIGLLGPGPLSSSTVGKGSALSGEYERFIRYQAPQLLRLHVRPKGTDSLVHLRLSRAFVDKVEMMHINPDPVDIKAEPNHFSYFFARGDASRTPDDSLTFTFEYQPEEFGNMDIEAEVPNLHVLRFNQFVYP
jgi:hypothetical protein